MADTSFCWICALKQATLNCPSCNRNYHITCIKRQPKGALLLTPQSERKLQKFAKPCEECSALQIASLRWSRGDKFKPLDRETCNDLINYLLEEKLRSAPEPFTWSANRFPSCLQSMDVDIIKKKALERKYNNVAEFRDDMRLIHHNCRVVMKNNQLVDYQTYRELKAQRSQLDTFIETVIKQIRYVEDCPYCKLNFRTSKEKWLSMPCPWGHQLILVNFGGKLWPAKLVYPKGNHFFTLLFGTGEWHRVPADVCWLPSMSDLSPNSQRRGLDRARAQAREYAEELKKKFGNKFRMVSQRRLISSFEKHYIDNNPVEKTDDNVITLSDDESEPENDEKCNNSNESDNGDMSTDIGDRVIDEFKAESEINSEAVDMVSSTCEQLPNASEESRTTSDLPTDQIAPENLLQHLTPSVEKTEENRSLDESVEPVKIQKISVQNENAQTIPDQNEEMKEESLESPTMRVNSPIPEEFVIETDVDFEEQSIFQYPFISSPDEGEPNFMKTSKTTSDFLNPNGSTIHKSINCFDDTRESLLNEPANKKIKLEEKIYEDQSLEVVKMKEHLEYMKKEKMLLLRRIDDLEEQLKLTAKMSQTKIEAMELHFLSKIKVLEDELIRKNS